ncbi:MAG: hypothetical protein A3H93_11635 [Rhodocyclales bacterium RIFCSPLOWO2_02_FULL_63_24]|nr:MAG: hypothetical protein A2040_00275 [Rhodocyclales bacterium GWA2_65_19]OHC71091.1 MAG: hypothetical protein A3H93_11635 [Rhodocyclales bacterium RIFCSPLOWO2_02_FULL_63_24]
MSLRLRDKPIWIRLIGVIGVLLIVGWAVMVVWSAIETRRTAMSQARDLAASVHQITMANLLFMKVTKTIKKRSLFYDQVRQSEAVRDLRVLRGDKVTHEMGDGDEIAMNPDVLEKQVMAEGKIVFQETQDPAMGHVLRAVFPATASKNYLGKNCMECHEEAKEGDILGAVSMKIILEGADTAVRNAEAKLFIVANVITWPLLIFIFLFVRGTVTRPLGAMTRQLQAIAEGEGDLTQRLPVHGGDEIGTASDSFNRMMEKLQTLIVSVNHTAERVSLSASQLSETSEQIAAGSSAQTSKSTSAASSIEQMAGSVLGVAESCQKVEKLSVESRTSTESGTRNMDELQQRIRQVEQSVGEIASSVESFLQRTATISAMTQQVKDIADQTNLLALNAAIEAARAGEHGRGFAVVADEVRKLAEKSSASASEIDSITRSLGAESGRVNDAIGKGLAVLESTHASMVTVTTILKEASSTVDKVAEGMGGIRNATSEQSTTGAHLAESVESIAALARDNAQLIENMTVATRELASLARDLQSDMGRFTV